MILRASPRKVGSAIIRQCAARMSAYWGPSLRPGLGFVLAGGAPGGVQSAVEPLKLGGDRLGRDRTRRQPEAARIEHHDRADRDSRADGLTLETCMGNSAAFGGDAPVVATGRTARIRG